MGRLFSDIDATPEPVAPDPVPAWLRNLLTETVGLSEDEVDAMTPEQATEIVQAHWSTRRD
jgi:mRNA interferase RelE/StbE